MNKLGKFTPTIIPNSERIPEEMRVKDWRDTTNMTPSEKRNAMYNDSNKVVYAVFLNIRKPLNVDYKGEPWSNSPIDTGNYYYVTYQIGH